MKAAIGLPPGERRATVEAFFSLHPGVGAGRFGLGQAILDFQAWETDSGRITDDGGSAWWRSINGRMVLDIAGALRDIADESPAVKAWRSYASGDGTQAELWEAHQRSLHAALRANHSLLDDETPAERAFAEIVVDIVDRTALAGRPTDSFDLAELTKRYYPWAYPAVPGSLPRLELVRVRTADQLRGPDGLVLVDVGIGSARWA